MTALPTGVVTFVFSDIEASTRMLERHGRTAGQALARHHELLAGAIAGAGGIVFETVGDAVYSAFSGPADGLIAGVEMQRAMGGQDWGEIGEVRVRISVHTGAVESRERHYFGAALFETARLQSLAHGGQTLASARTVGLAGGSLPNDIKLTPLGRHRLKDLAAPMDVIQVNGAETRADFPALRASIAIPNNLPTETTSFIGRDDDLERLERLLKASRLVTVLGPGGTGKTRLAIELARRRLQRHPDGVFLVDLSAITDPQLVAPAIAGALSVRQQPSESVEASLIAHLAELDVLLILDNWEQVIEAAPVVGRLLATSQRLAVLATSRVPLRLRGEARDRLPPLSVDVTSASEPGALIDVPAVRLFVDRAQAAAPDFDLSEANAADVHALCRHLDGLPLAIELAAARIDLLTPVAMLRSLSSSSSILQGGGDLPDRQRSLRDTVAWSADLLPVEHRDVLHTLSVFPGTFPLSGVEAIMGPESGLNALTALGALADASLLAPREDPLGEPRFAMLETVRSYAMDQLAAAGRVDDALRRHAGWVADLSELGESGVHGKEGRAWVRVLDLHRGDVRDALAWTIAAPFPEVAARIVGGMRRCWVMRRAGEDGSAWCRRVLGLGLSPRWEARVLHTLGNIQWVGGLLSEAAESEGRAVEIYEQTGPARELAEAVNYLGIAFWELDDVTEAQTQFLRSRALWHAIGDPGGEAVPTGNLGVLAAIRGDVDLAVSYCQDALALDLESGAPLGIAESYLSFATAEITAGLWRAALDHIVAGLREAREVWDEMWLTIGIEQMASVRLHADSSDPVTAGRLLGSARKSRELRRLHIHASDQKNVEHAHLAVRAALGTDSSKKALDDGAALDLDAAVAYALGEIDPFTLEGSLDEGPG